MYAVARRKSFYHECTRFQEFSVLGAKISGFTTINLNIKTVDLQRDPHSK